MLACDYLFLVHTRTNLMLQYSIGGDKGSKTKKKIQWQKWEKRCCFRMRFFGFVYEEKICSFCPSIALFELRFLELKDITVIDCFEHVSLFC